MESIQNYFDSEGKLKVWPSKRTAKLKVLKYLAQKFEYNRFYTEKEVNKIIEDNHCFNDYFILRRELINNKLLIRLRDGSRYWRGTFISEEKFQTQSLTIENCSQEYKESIKEAYMSCSYMGEYTGESLCEQDIDNIMNNPELPPGGSREFTGFKLIREVDSQSVIGGIEYYTGYDDSSTLWIGLMFIHKNFQTKGFGSEVIKAFTELARSGGFKRIGLGVYLKNWQGLRFWIREGFNQIRDMHGDRVFGQDKFALLSLYKQL